MVALVTGGGGRLGNVLVRRLLERGEKVRVLEPGGLPESLRGLDIDFSSGSVLDAGDVARAVDGTGVVYHLAAKIDLSPKKDPMMYSINVEGTRKVVEACLARKLRLVHTSSHHALVREPLDEPLTEDKPLALNEKCEYHRSKAIGETIVLDACQRGLDAVIVNPGSMIGPHDYAPSMIGAALIDMYLGRVPVLLDLLSDYVDVRDVADGMISAAQKGRRGERYFLTGDVIPIMEMASLYGEVTGVKMPARALPLWVGWALLPISLLGSAISNKEPFLTADMLRASVSNEVVSHDKAHRELGYTIRALRESLTDAVAWYRERGWLDG
ncbi:MAG: NAD-dependent epimerase/dehydratase family protein [Deltaproteobacteria bacterium]|nr:NAD-dependent epimerase/dehydratase family protein [Deltaproteobacteria bacterium]NND27488.1 NAD-dependent epimerase/dehydratase family protein [Myxococcales bacterium]MBT8482112.1 NAD-dependent epimerase/dehydratase family protein [Deltaproteobacteria bacterium]NNK09669.1 NAD-dependent epimerase/dehydratase family protein [Myxococcales bacterium]NNL24973.1 NAD-dependent epimerase/dehydratase family protein [Myxococcales bacterium]